MSGGITQVTGITATQPSRGQLLNALTGKCRMLLVGDSITNNALFAANLPTTAGSFVVANGLGTLTFGATVAPLTGEYFSLNDIHDATYAHPDNGRFVQAITGSPTSGSASAVVTFASLAANGDYSNLGPGGWAISSLCSSCDSGLATWLNMFLRAQFTINASIAAVGQTSAQTLVSVARYVPSPAVPSEFALIACDGINDFVASNGTIASANAAAANYIAAIQLLQGAGYTVMMQTPNPINASSGGFLQQYNIAIACLRKQLMQYARRNRALIVLDAYKEMIAGQFTSNALTGNGYSAANAAGHFINSTDNIHPNSNAYCTMARNEAANLTGILLPFEDTPVTLLDDGATFAQAGNPYNNMMPNGGMAGTTGTLAGGATGTVATGYTLTANTATVVGTGGATPTQIGLSNSENYSFAQRIQCTTTAAAQGFTLQNFGANKALGVYPGFFEIGFRIYVRGSVGGLPGTPSGCGSLFGTWNIGPFNFVLNGSAGLGAGNVDDVGIQLQAGDVLYIKSIKPVFLQAQPGNMLWFCQYISLGAGSIDLEVSAGFIRQADNPNV